MPTYKNLLSVHIVKFFQVVMRTTVSPWTEDLVLTDAFRAPLVEVFKLLEVIRNYQLENR
jgi:hypothetical protein